MTLSELRDESRWLNGFAFNEFSQTGEDGILEKVFSVIPDLTKWCVEFGAWDGKHFSNTHRLIQKAGWHAVMIEGSASKFEDLKAAFPGRSDVICLNAMVGWQGTQRLDHILSTTGIPKNPDLLSIDIDGNDYHVWAALKEYRPKVVVIEYNPTIQTEVDFVQEPAFSVSRGCSLAALIRLGKEKEYELICVTDLNAIFVEKHLHHLFKIQDNCAEVMRPETDLMTHVFFGYDGATMVRGLGKAHWQGARLHEASVQAVPRYLQGWLEKPSWPRRHMIKFHSMLKKLGLG